MWLAQSPCELSSSAANSRSPRTVQPNLKPIMSNVSAWRRIAALLPQVSLVSTSQLLKHWADTQHITLKDVCTALQSMRRRGGYRFQKHDPLGDWLQQLIDGSHKTTPNKQNLG